MPTYRGGRHEHGQNFLNDPKTIKAIHHQVASTSGPIFEIGPGRGALTFGLQRLRRPLTAVEIDAKHVRWLEARVESHVDIVHADFLRWHLPRHPHVVVANVPFHQTTAVLRKLLHAPGWTSAVLIVQWEVARRRAGIGGATMMTAQWWPWVDFTMAGRIPAAAFRPAPSVDAATLVMQRRDRALIEANQRSAYRHFVYQVFTGRGAGIAAIVDKVVPARARPDVGRWLASAGVNRRALPKDLTAQQWAGLFKAVRRRR